MNQIMSALVAACTSMDTEHYRTTRSAARRRSLKMIHVIAVADGVWLMLIQNSAVIVRSALNDLATLCRCILASSCYHPNAHPVPADQSRQKPITRPAGSDEGFIVSEFKREGRYIVVKPDCEDSIRTERLRNYIDEMCFNTPDCVVVEADWPEYEPVWRMIERRVMGLPDEITAAQSELTALREENERLKSESFEELYNAAIDERDALLGEVAKWKGRTTNVCMKLTAAEQRNAELERDAARYRWLRDINVGPATIDRLIFQTVADDCNPPYRDMKHGVDLDAAIDSQIKPTESGASE